MGAKRSLNGFGLDCSFLSFQSFKSFKSLKTVDLLLFFLRVCMIVVSLRAAQPGGKDFFDQRRELKTVDVKVLISGTRPGLYLNEINL